MDDFLGSEDSKTLVGLCRTGRLYAVEKWIAAGKSLRLPPERRTSILRLAFDTGFHSLIDLIARHEPDQGVKNEVLRQAVARANIDLVQLVLAHGADLKSVPFADVLFSWNPKLMKFFLSSGADPISGAPFAHAFRMKIRTAIGPFLECRREHPEWGHQLQEQLDCALRAFCSNGDLKWVSLLMWAGADPRSWGPTLDTDHTDDPDYFTSAMEEACNAENVNILKRLKPEPARDDLTRLVPKAAFLARMDTVSFLLDLGARPNDKEDGGSSALDWCLAHFEFERFKPYRQRRSIYDCDRTLGCIRVLAEHGALWRPDGPEQLTIVRRSLYGCEPEVTLEVLRIFVKNNTSSQETIEALLRPPRMREHLSSKSWHLDRLGLRFERDKKTHGKQISAALLDRFDRDVLYQKVWASPVREVAKAYGVSDVWLSKICKALRVPVPGRGYWARKRSCLAVPPRPALPPKSKRK